MDDVRCIKHIVDEVAHLEKIIFVLVSHFYWQSFGSKVGMMGGIMSLILRGTMKDWKKGMIVWDWILSPVFGLENYRWDEMIGLTILCLV